MSSKSGVSSPASGGQDYNRVSGEGVEDDDSRRRKNPILHVIVVGFHHKKGCQVGKMHIIYIYI